MTHRYTFPQVREVVSPRADTRPPIRPPTQRELVAASLMARSARLSGKR